MCRDAAWKGKYRMSGLLEQIENSTVQQISRMSDMEKKLHYKDKMKTNWNSIPNIKSQSDSSRKNILSYLEWFLNVWIFVFLGTK